MASKSPVFPMPQPQQQHFSDYGFDPQINYFQVLEEARKHKRESRESRSLDSLHFKLQKPISKEDSKKAKKKKKWWSNALHFWKWKGSEENGEHRLWHDYGASRASDWYRSRSASVPVYGIGEMGPWTPSRSRPSTVPLAGALTPARKGDLEIPYLSLREIDVEPQQRISASSMPIYLVT